MNPRPLFIVGGVILLLVGGIAGYLLAADSTPTKTVTITTSDANEQVRVAYETHLALLGDRDISALVSGYDSNATVEWRGSLWD